MIKLLLPSSLDNTDTVSYSYGIAKNPSGYAPCGNLQINVLGKDVTSNIACSTEPTGFCPTVSIQTGFLSFNYTTIVNSVITNRQITKRVNQ